MNGTAPLVFGECGTDNRVDLCCVINPATVWAAGEASTNSSSSSSLASGGKTSENFLYGADILSVLVVVERQQACNELAELNSNRLILLLRRICQHTRKTSYVQRARWNRIFSFFVVVT
jgi:hypothetical protein